MDEEVLQKTNKLKKIAVIIYGEFRTFPFVWKFWDYDESTTDLYISSWIRSTEKRNGWVEWNEKEKQWEGRTVPRYEIPPNHVIKSWSNVEHEVTEDMFDEFKKEHPNSTILLHCNFAGQKEIDNIVGGPVQATGAKMIYHWKKALKHIQTTDKEYEGIVLLRIDSLHSIEWSKLFNDIKNNPNTFFSCTPDSDFKQKVPSMNDIGIYGDWDTMVRWIEELDYALHHQNHRGIALHTINGNFNHKESSHSSSLIMRMGQVEYLQRLPSELKANNLPLKGWEVCRYYEHSPFNKIFHKFVSSQAGDIYDLNQLVWKPGIESKVNKPI